MFGPYTKADEAYDRARDREERRRARSLEKMRVRLPFRLEALARAKAGEITLEEAKRIIAKHERMTNREC